MYYIIINNQQAGPMTVQQLLASGLRRDSMVWKQGMPAWTPAEQVPELMAALNMASTPNNPAPPQQQAWQQPQPTQAWQQQPQQQAWQPQPQQQQSWQQQPNGFQQGYIPTQVSTWNTWAIISMILGLCSCIGLVLGIIGTVNINKAKSAYMAGDGMRGESLLSSGRTLTIIALIFDAIGLIINALYLPTMLNAF